MSTMLSVSLSRTMPKLAGDAVPETINTPLAVRHATLANA